MAGLDRLNAGQGFLSGLIGQKESVGRGQLDSGNLNYRPALLVVPTHPDLDLRKERLVVAAPGRVVGGLVDGLNLARQLKSRAQVLMLQLEPGLRLGQRFLSFLDLSSHPRPLGSESIRRYVVALLGVEADESPLLSLELGYQLGPCLADLNQALLSNFGHRVYGGLTPLHLGVAQLHFGVLADNRCLNQLRSDVGATLGAGCPIDPAGAEKIWILAAVFAGTDAVGQAAATPGAKDAAAKVVLALARTLSGYSLFVKEHLHLVEGLLVDQWLMATLEPFLI